MEEAFDLLDNQPTGFPKWQLGVNAEGENLWVKHMFIADEDVVVPGCRFVPGAEWVGRASKWDQMLASDGDPLCQDCIEVYLQHGLARVW